MMHTIPDNASHKAILVAVFFAGFLMALLWLLCDVAASVMAVLKAVR